MAKRDDQPQRLGPRRFGAGQLAWVVRNRQLPARWAPVGMDAGRADLARSASDHRAREVFDAIGAVVDEPFRTYCRFDEYRGGTVRILVNPPEMLYHIRSVWQARLLRELAQTGRRGTIRKIVFVALKDDDADRPDSQGIRFSSH